METKYSAAQIIARKTDVYNEKVKNTVYGYLDIFFRKNQKYKDLLYTYERILAGFGFNAQDIRNLQMISFEDFYTSLEPLAPYEIIYNTPDLF